ncbi:MAG TPA: SIR2 family protein [Planctomycetota bacterium]|nr:SIR2 family protein [Planctomycetota bacterium]
MKLSLLLGSGISLKAGKPCIGAMNSSILDGMVQHQEFVGNFAKADDRSDGLAFIKLVIPYIEKFHKAFRITKDVNYEDIFYLISQIHDQENREYENPGIEPLIDAVKQQLASAPELNGKQLIDVSRKACEYIRDCVWRLLAGPATGTEHLRVIADICRANKDVNIITLNHDTVLEEFLESHGIAYNDGFTHLNGEKCFDPASVRNQSGVMLIKLHGSINWFRRHGDSSKETVFKTGKRGFERTENAKGENQWLVDGYPMLLIGNHNKILEYTTYVFSHLYCAFHRALEESDRLMICGYGYCDKAVNSRVVEWMLEKDKSIVVVHRDPDKLMADGRPAMQALNSYPSYKQIRKWMEPSLTWDEIRLALEPSAETLLRQKVNAALDSAILALQQQKLP